MGNKRGITMEIKNIFDKGVTEEVIQRIHSLTPESKALWGKMNVSQMLAHLSVTYEMIFTDKHKKPNAFLRFIIKSFIKGAIVGPKPYKKNGQTAPAFLIVDEREFETEKKQLIEYLQKTQELGKAHFEGKESLSFGKLSSSEWNTLFYKHVDHHLHQFGA